jgi:hypothetical protein
MSTLSDFLTRVTHLFGHLHGDPTHTQSAGALTATLKAAAKNEETGNESGTADLHDEVEKILATNRAVTPQEWQELKALAEKQLKTGAAGLSSSPVGSLTTAQISGLSTSEAAGLTSPPAPSA